MDIVRPDRSRGSVLAVALLLVVSLPAAADGGAPGKRHVADQHALSTRTAADPTRHTRFEKLALRLLNCTRSGGWVRPDGSCKAWGSGRFSPYRKPLPRHRGISVKVAWPWAAELVKADTCAHSIDGLPDLGQRLRGAGFAYHTYGENIGCTWGYTLRRTIIWSHRAMQAERASNGGHWRNMKSRSYRSVGIGVARLGSMTAVVFDFYGRAPR